MMMGAEVFVDNNILLRVILTQMNQHAEVDTMMKRVISEGAQLQISEQVIREFIVQAAQPRILAEPLTIERIVRKIEAMKTLLLATMLAHEIDTLMTLNVDDMKRFADKIRIVSLEGRNP